MRAAIGLNNGWRFRLEPVRDLGRLSNKRDKNTAAQARSGIGTVITTQRTCHDVPTLDQPTWQAVDLPHDWAATAATVATMDWGVDQAFRWRWGIGWYAKTFAVTALNPGRRFLLDSDGIYEDATVYVNGVAAGTQAYGYSPFRLDITPFLHRGSNELLIRVDNTTYPTDRWYSGAGVYRDLRLLEVDEDHLDERDIRVTTEIDLAAGPRPEKPGTPVAADDRQPGRAAGPTGTDKSAGPTVPSAQVNVSTGLDAPVRARLTDGTTVFEATGSHGQLCLSVDPAHLWSAEDPHLYTLTVSLLDGQGRVCDEIGLHIGLRTVSFDPAHGMSVNGTRTVLKGVCLHQDMGALGSVAPPELWRERLEMLKQMGCNAIRAAHHMHSRQFMDLCDELGFYVYEEPFDKWQSGHYQRFFEAGWQTDLQAMLRRDRNRPSVVIWGVGNEVENQAHTSMLAILDRLVAQVKALDDSRPVTCALSPHFQYEVPSAGQAPAADFDFGRFNLGDDKAPADNQEITDPADRVDYVKRVAAHVDLLALNYSEQWYERIHTAVPDKPILGTEVYQYFMGHDEQMQNYTERNPNLLPLAAGRGYLVGGLVWAGFDYLGESMGYPSRGWSGALIRTDGRPKPGYYLLKSYWTSRRSQPLVHFGLLDYRRTDENVKEHWDIPPYLSHWDLPGVRRLLVPYLITTNCQEVRLYLNGKRYHLGRPADNPNQVIQGFLPYQPGELRVEGYADGVLACEQVLRTPLAGPRTLRFVDSFGTALASGETGRADGQSWTFPVAPASTSRYQRLHVLACDQAGTPCTREQGLVTFSVSGPATIAAVDNGCLLDEGLDEPASTHLYQGGASVIVRLSGQPGQVTVRAQWSPTADSPFDCVSTPLPSRPSPVAPA